MSRLFTINFRFKEEPINAIVNLDTSGYDLSVNVRYLNQEVADIIPGRRIRFSLAEGLQTDMQSAGKFAEELIYKTSEAISDYLTKF